MSLVKCKECKKEVSRKAKTCPYCGVKDPGATWVHILAGFGVLAVIVLGLASCISRDDKADENQISATEEAACKADMQCWAQRHLVMASVNCTPEIEKLAKYDYEWTGSSLSPKLSRFKMSIW